MKNKGLNNLIVSFGGVILAIILSTNTASAYVPGVWDPQPRVRPESNSMFLNLPIGSEPTYSAQTTSQNAVSTNRAITASGGVTTQPVQNTATTTTKNVTVSRVATEPVLQPLNTTTATVYRAVDTSNNNLAALSLRGSGSFMPSSVWGWLLVIILILVIVILARMLSKGHIVHHYDDHHGAPVH